MSDVLHTSSVWVELKHEFATDDGKRAWTIYTQGGDVYLSHGLMNQQKWKLTEDEVKWFYKAFRHVHKGK